MKGKETSGCSLCGGVVTRNPEEDLHWHGKDQNGQPTSGYLEAGWCESCALKLGRRIDSHSKPTWCATSVQPSWLLERISPAELAKLNEKLGRYETVGSNWTQFLERMKNQDEIWRYKDPNNGHTAVCVVREGAPVAAFTTLGNL
jgi:hypothetical protein